MNMMILEEETARKDKE